MAACLSIHAVAIVVGITLLPYALHYMSAEVPEPAVEAMRGAASTDSG